MARKVNKFNNIRCIYNGIKFDSILERDTYIWMSKYLPLKAIDFSLQVPFDLGVCKYKADFVLKSGEKELVLDMKSKPTVTQIFKLKKSLMRVKLNKDVKVAYSVQEVASLVQNEFS